MAVASCSDALIRDVLVRSKAIAVVGASPNPLRPSFRVTAFLAARGYRVFAVNPSHAGAVISDAPTYARLADIPAPIDIVDVFRASEHLAGVIEEALALTPRPTVIWTQLGVRDNAAAAWAEAEGLTVIQDRCPKIEIARLF